MYFFLTTLGIVPGVFQAVNKIQCFDFVVCQPVESYFGSVKNNLNNQNFYAIFRFNGLINLFFDYKNEMILHELMTSDQSICIPTVEICS